MVHCLFLREYDIETVRENTTWTPHLNYPDLAEAGNPYSKDVSITDINDGDKGLVEETLAYKNFDHESLKSSFLLDLRKKPPTQQERPFAMLVWEKHEILVLDTKTRMSMLKETSKRNNSQFILDYEKRMITDCTNALALAFNKFKSQK